MSPQLKTLHFYRQSNEPCPNALAKFILIEDRDGNWRYHQYAGEPQIERNDDKYASEAEIVANVRSRVKKVLENEVECVELCDKPYQVASIGEGDALIDLVKELLKAL